MVSFRQLTVFFILFLTRFVNGSISIDKNGYSGLLVAISEEMPQPQDGGLELIDRLKNILKETSADLYQSTNHRAYFKSIDILLPRSWNAPIMGLTTSNTKSLRFSSADFRIGSGIAYESTSSETYMGMTYTDVLSKRSIKDQSQNLLKKWFKYRYDIDFDPESRYFYDQPEDQGMINYVVSIVRNVLHGSNVLQVEHSADFLNSNAPRLDIDPTPQFRFFRATPFVIYLAVDTSAPVGNNPLSTVRTALRALLNNFEPTDSIKMAVSSFEGSDSGPGTYLMEKLPPSAISDNAISNEIGNLQTSTNELNRDVGAAIRDAITKLEPYKDQGGSILYLVTASQSQSSELELDVVENLIKNNIQLVAVEAGGGTHNALQRFSLLSHGEYFPTESYGSAGFFTSANRLVASLSREDPLIIDRQILFYENNEINSGSSWSGSFQVASDLGTDTVVAFHSPLEGLFTLSINGPDGSSNTLTNGPSSTNWNDPAATVGLASVTISNFDGEWNFELEYDSSSCADCSETATVFLQVTSSSFSGPRTTPTEGTTTTQNTDITTNEITTESQTSPNTDATTTGMTSSTVTSDPLETTSETEPTTRGTQEPTSDPNSSTTSISTSTTERTETTTGSTEMTTWTTLETTVCIPFFEFRPKEAETKVVYIAVATSFPVGTNPIIVTKRALQTLVSTLPEDTYVAVANFEGGDTGVGNYLQEIIGLTQILSDSAAITNAIDNLVTSSNYVRDVGAALRDTIEKIKSYKDEDGSILYFITYTGSVSNSTTWELDIADTLINSRIQLVAVEAGPETDGLKKSLERVSALTNGFYYYTERFGTDEFFTPVNEQILKTVEDPIETGRRSLLYQKEDVGAADVSGSFTIDTTSNLNPVISLQSPKDISVTVQITSPGGDSLPLDSNENGWNWNAPGASTGVFALDLPSPAATGRWTYVISADQPGTVALQVTSTLNTGESTTEQTTIQSTTTEEPTTEPTTQLTTTEEPTTEQTTRLTTTEETTAEQTTTQPTTTEEPTTEAETTTTEQTTSQQTTSDVTSSTQEVTTSEFTSTTTTDSTIETSPSTETSTTSTDTPETTTVTETPTETSTTSASTTSEGTTTPQVTTSEVTSTEYSTTICYTTTTISTVSGSTGETSPVTSTTTVSTTAATNQSTTESITESTTEGPDEPILTTAEIVGIAVGGAAGAALIVGGSVYAVRRSRSSSGSSRGFSEAAPPPPPPSQPSARPPPPPSYDPPGKSYDGGRLEPPSSGRSLPQPSSFVEQPQHFVKPNLYDEIDEVEVGVTFEDDDAFLTAL